MSMVGVGCGQRGRRDGMGGAVAVATSGRSVAQMTQQQLRQQLQICLRLIGLRLQAATTRKVCNINFNAFVCHILHKDSLRGYTQRDSNYMAE